MINHSIKVNPIAGHIGAEILGVDLSKSMSNSLAQTLKQSLFEHGVIFFREQNLKPEDHIAMAESFGEIEINRFFKPVEGYAKIAEVRKEPHQKRNIGAKWHTDHSYDTAPAMGSILYALEVPPVGGDTIFASMYAAYDHLSDGLKETLHNLKAWHSSEETFGVPKDKDIGDRIGGQENVKPDVLHPVIIGHPSTGRSALYVNPQFTVRFDGWTEEESKPLLEYLYQFATQPAFCCRFHWEKGTVAFWDNRISQHLAVNDYHGHRRLMHRITLKGVPIFGATQAS
ncbi:MAG: TauD/TfdA family dioxygenase [Chloroflexota bacterium]